MHRLIHNPVLPGFHPDPSFVRVGPDFYLASSTFEWLPGVRIHHSRDLVNWRLLGHALTRPEHIDLRGVEDSCGSWAPSLSHADGRFWLVYTNVRTCRGGFMDSHVYLTTAPAATGPWSEPVHLNSIGFDPSLFHDDDGRKWLVNMQWDFRKAHYRFAGIVIQEYDASARRLTGPVHEILRKPDVLCEGPNLYKRNGWYYLMMAEGGTGWNHGISMARSRSITGPYELDPQEAVLTTRHAPEHPLQKAGHGELVRTPGGEWWLAHLCSRPLRIDEAGDASARAPFPKSHPGRRCILGRETALQRVKWTDDGWLRLANGTMLPDVVVEAPAELAPHPWPKPPARDDFDAPALGPKWATLRTPADPSWLSLAERPGWLRLRGRESPQSWHEQSLVGRRLRGFRTRAETCMDFLPARFTQMAGLVAWYNTRSFYFLRVTRSESEGRVLGVVSADGGAYDEPAAAQIGIEGWPLAYLRAEIDHARLRFFASPDGRDWRRVGADFDASTLSDDHGGGLRFTGAFLGLSACDMAGQGGVADFDYFRMEEF